MVMRVGHLLVLSYTCTPLLSVIIMIAKLHLLSLDHQVGAVHTIGVQITQNFRVNGVGVFLEAQQGT